MSTFSRELLQAINDWQRGGSPEQKAKRGQQLKANALALSKTFRQCRLCYRQIALPKDALWKLADNLELPETISAWTESLDVARIFKNGVPPVGYQGVIFLLFPPQESIIVNLNRLYLDEEFQEAIKEHSENIRGFHYGMGSYKNSQEEVVVEVNKIRLNDIHELGGYSSSREELTQIMYGPDVAPESLAKFDRLLSLTGLTLGPAWIRGDAKDRTIRNISAIMPRLRLIKKLQEYSTLQDSFDRSE